MKRTIYLHTCMECGFDWESTIKDETHCPVCRVGDIHSEEVDDDKDEI